MDKTIFAEKFTQLGFDAKSFEIQKKQYLEVIDKLEPHIQKILLAELDLFIQTANVLSYALKKDELFSYIDGITNNFVTENEVLRYDVDSFTAFMAERANISCTFLPGFRASKLACGKKTKQHYSPQMDVVIPLLAEVIPANHQILWLIFYDLVLIYLIERLALQWTNTHPQFQDAVSKDQALDMYVRRDTPSANDKFPFVCWLFYKNIDSRDLQDIYKHIEEEIELVKRELEAARIKEKLLQSKHEVIAQRPAIGNTKESVTIKKIDKYSGAEFEAFIGSLFEADGYQVEFTQASNDKGIDIIAKRNGISIGIQCKRYSSTVGIASVQEVFSGKNFYSLDKALVVTNNFFTKAAKDLAESTGVVLWDRELLDAKIKLIY